MKLALRSTVMIPPAQAFALSPDGSQFAIATISGQKLQTYDTAGMSLAHATRLGAERTKVLVYSPDGRFIAAGAKTITLFDTATLTKGVQLKGHDWEVESAAFSPDGTKVYTCSGDTTVRCWNTATGAKLWKWKGDLQLYGVAASPDGTMVATAGWNGKIQSGEVKLIDAATGVVRWSAQEDQFFYGLCFTPDSARLVASGDRRPHLSVYATVDGAARTLPTQSGTRKFVLTPDGTTAIWGSNVADIATGEVHSSEALVRFSYDFAFSRDGKQICAMRTGPTVEHHEVHAFDVQGLTASPLPAPAPHRAPDVAPAVAKAKTATVTPATTESAPNTVDLAEFMLQLDKATGDGRVDKVKKMLRADRFQLFSDVQDDHVTGVVKSQTDPTLFYACKVDQGGNFMCCTQNLNTCGGLRGKPCKHLLVLMVGLAQAGQLTPATGLKWARATADKKPVLDKEAMSATFIRYKGAEAGEIDWRPTETIPEDYYAL